MAELIWSDVTVTRDAAILLDGVSFALRSGEVVAMLGANGAGKTTALRAAAGALTPQSGEVMIDDARVTDLSSSARARLMSYLPQQRPLAWPITVRDLVALGRFAFGAAPHRLSEMDSARVDEALSRCDLVRLQDRRADTLSGGELARAHVARAFAAQAPILLADEPTAALDPLHATQIMALIAEHARDGGAAMVATHDVALAARYATRIVALKQGRVLMEAGPATAVDSGFLEACYGLAPSPQHQASTRRN